MITILHGDCIEQMRTLPPESVHCIVTSPPYWGLRDYQLPPSMWADGWNGVFGLEPTPELYLAHLVEIMSEARRVLRKDGTLWVNLGDSYASGGNGSSNTPHCKQFTNRGFAGVKSMGVKTAPFGLKAGDLVGIPWRAVFAMQADGWWHRRDNIWFKPNPMPESVNGWRWEKCRIKIKAQVLGTRGSVGNSKRSRDMSNGQYLGSAEYVDCPGCEKCAPNGGLILRKGNWRCTTSHEYVFQFSKSASYFCDAEAAREVFAPASNKRSHRADSFKRNGSKRGVAHLGQNMGTHRPDRPDVAYPGVGGRNRRSVWRIATKPYRGAHFATFPPDLVRPIILAASSPQCCATCAAPYAPVIQRGEPDLAHQIACGGSKSNGSYSGQATKDFESAGAEDASAVKARILAGMVKKTVIGYRATCACSLSAAAPAIVLDMFGGSGTVGQVAQELGRDAILIELNSDYIQLIKKRTNAPTLAL